MHNRNDERQQKFDHRACWAASAIQATGKNKKTIIAHLHRAPKEELFNCVQCSK